MIKNLTPRLAEAGKIKIGGLGDARRAESGRTYRLPVGYDHFVITKTRRDEQGDLIVDTELMDAIRTLGGDSPDGDGKIRSIPICLHSDELDEVFPTSYSYYAGKRLFCRGDGEEATRYEIDQQTRRHTGNSQPVKCTCKYLDMGRCKPHGTLRCSIAAPGHAVAGAVHLWRTTSMISIERMLGSLEQILSICGTLRGVPLWLKLEPVTVSPEDAPTKDVYCCHIELRARDVLSVQRQALEAKQIRDRVAGNLRAPALTEPLTDDGPDEQEAIGGEFHPESATDVPPYSEETGEVFDDGWPRGRDDHT